MGLAATFGPYSPVRQAGDFFFVSGQVGIDVEKKAERGVAEQTHQALKNLTRVLQSEALTMTDVVKTTVFLKNIDDFAAVNDVYVTYFPAPRPARSCVEVVALPRLTDTALLVEIEAIAYRNPS